MNIKSFFKELFGVKDPVTVDSMLFHLYNTKRRLKGSCAFEKIELIEADGKKFHVYGVAMTKVDKTDAPTATKHFGFDETSYRLDSVLDYYENHRDAAIDTLKDGAVVWMDDSSCLIPFKTMLSPFWARQDIALAMKKCNPIQSFMPRFLKRSKTRGELNY